MNVFKLLLLAALFNALHASQAMVAYNTPTNTSTIPWWLGGTLWHQAYEKIKEYIPFNTTAALDYPKHYSINLMWINRQIQPDQACIYSSSNDDNRGNKFLDTIILWAKKNPEATIHLWFDSFISTPAAIKNTHAIINEEVAKYQKNRAKIELNDIRNLRTVKNNPEIFSSDIPVYFRADFLRAVIAEETLRQNQNICFVYADFDVKPLTKTELFDRKTLENMKKYHFVMAQEANKLGFENSFQIFTYDETLLKAMDTMLIQANLLRAHSFLEAIKQREQPNTIFSNPHIWKLYAAGFQENLFYSYPLMYAYWAQLKNISPLVLPGSNKPYNDELDIKMLDEVAKVIMTRSSAAKYITDFPIPTKRVSIPPTTSLEKEAEIKS